MLCGEEDLWTKQMAVNQLNPQCFLGNAAAMSREMRTTKGMGELIEVGAFHERFVECSRSSVESDAKGKSINY
ncbi:hypothetical protein ACFX13_002431 [Malus domestica]